MGSTIRDLRTNQLTSVGEARAHAVDIRARFTSERWRAFVANHAWYLDNMPPGSVDWMRRDHGYNPTPAWTFVARVPGTRVPSTSAGLYFLASLDVLILTVMLATVWRTFGARATFLAVAILGFGHGWRSIYIGAFLRLDWLAAVVCGVCMLERRRHATAGALFGYATAVRVFPLLFLVAPGCWPSRPSGGASAPPGHSAWRGDLRWS